MLTLDPQGLRTVDICTYFIRRSKDFEKSFSKLKRLGVKKKVLDDIVLVIDMLAHEEVLSSKYRDHKLQGDYAGYRECHI